MIYKFCISQNLVSNGDFENYFFCPSGPGQLAKAIGWSAPPNNDAEYLNVCSTDPNFGVPSQNNYNFQLAHSGNGYVSIIMYDWPGLNYREYAQTKLNSTLVSNNNYYVSFYVNRANAIYGGKFAINNISLSFQNIFSDTTSTSTSNNVLSYIPNVYKYNNPIIKDTMNWTKIEGVYEASGNENYIVIGNFKNDFQTDTINISDGSTYPGSSYFIDDVSVINITTPQWQYRDTSVVIGDSVLIGPAITGLNVDWYTMSSTFIKNAPGIYVKPIVNTSYKATETFNSAVYNHTVNVTVLPTALKDYEKLQSSVRLFPNPGNGHFTLQFANYKFGDVEVSISDVTGKEVFTKKLTIENTLAELNLNVNSGVYFVKITGQYQSLVKKLVVQ